jgi:hypothetical protein
VDRPNTAEIFDLQREREHRIRQATGGSGPPEPPGGSNWLAGMAEGTRFVARRKASLDPECDDFIVSLQFTDVVLLCKNVKGRDVVFEWYDTGMFSKQWQFYFIMERVIENGNDKQIHPRRLDEHAKPEGKHQPDEVPEH